MNETATPAPAEAAPLNPHADAAALDQLDTETGVGAAAPASQADDHLPTDKLLVMVIGPTAAILAPNWNISATEVESLSKAYAPLVDKYFPNIAMGPEIAAVLVTLAVVAPRAVTRTPLRAPAKKIEPAPADNAPAG